MRSYGQIATRVDYNEPPFLGFSRPHAERVEVPRIESPIHLQPRVRIARDRAGTPRIAPPKRAYVKNPDVGFHFNDNDERLVQLSREFHAWVIQSHQDGVPVAQIAAQGRIQASAVELHLKVAGYGDTK